MKNQKLDAQRLIRLVDGGKPDKDGGERIKPVLTLAASMLKDMQEITNPQEKSHTKEALNDKLFQGLVVELKNIGGLSFTLQLSGLGNHSQFCKDLEEEIQELGVGDFMSVEDRGYKLTVLYKFTEL